MGGIDEEKDKDVIVVRGFGFWREIIVALPLIVVVVGATLTFAGKADKDDVKICAVEFEQRIEKTQEQMHNEIKETEVRLLKKIEENQIELKERLDILLKNKNI